MVCKGETIFNILQAWVKNRGEEAYAKLCKHIIPIATVFVNNKEKRSDKPDDSIPEFALWVTTWLYEKSESAYTRGVETDPLSYAYHTLRNNIEKEPKFAENADGQRVIFKRILSATFKRYAYPDYIRWLESLGEKPKRLPKVTDNPYGSISPADEVDPQSSPRKGPLIPIFVPLEPWHISENVREEHNGYTEGGEPKEQVSEWENVPDTYSSDTSFDPRVSELKAFIASLSESNRVTLRIHCFPLLNELSMQDVNYVIEQQQFLSLEERLIDTSLTVEKAKAAILEILKKPLDYIRIGNLLGCKPNTANSRVLRAFAQFRKKYNHTKAGESPNDA